jgi:hypothetical protein
MPQRVRKRTDENAARNVPRLRKLEQIHSTVSQRLASADIEFEVLKGRLPATTRAWFAALATSPVCSVFDSNEDELRLHRTLLDSRRDSGSIARRRLLPASLPLRPRDNYFPETKRTWGQWLHQSGEHVSYLLSRIVHHLLALPRTAASGARWRWYLHGTLPPERAQLSEEE